MRSRALRKSEPTIIAALVLAVLLIGRFQGDALRNSAVAILSPFWHMTRVQAQVIFRTPTLWNSQLWINKGAGEVSINAPVLKQGALIGVVDYVGKNQSRIRLITDAKLNPAVRVVRGPLKMEKMLHDIDLLIDDFTFLVESPQTEIIEQLNDLKEKLFTEDPAWYLAKGYLQGASLPLAKSGALQLKGIGFNTDSGDRIKKNDLLITSGLDGIFPEGIPVAIVTKVEPLEEGDIYYTLWAKPVATELEDLHEVEILPSQQTDLSELPPTYGKY